MTNDLNKVLTFIPVSDVAEYDDWDNETGYGGTEHLSGDGGIYVLSVTAEGMKKHVANFEEMVEHYNNL